MTEPTLKRPTGLRADFVVEPPPEAKTPKKKAAPAKSEDEGE